ncbi:MAG: transglycosylase SLT domain-containing protein [Candidatus Obscuribacterales bacterium]|jgi:hypothetical protein|nr:transglycosylase SLT domain-containing protein [Candidatus Obscuribacterales bacterium]
MSKEGGNKEVAKPADQVQETQTSHHHAARMRLGSEAAVSLSSPPAAAVGDSSAAARAETAPTGDGHSTTPGKRALDHKKTPEQLVKAGAIVDKTSALDVPPAVHPVTDKTPPKIQVAMEDRDNPVDKQKDKPNFVVKADGQIEMHGNPDASKGKDIKVVLERKDGQVDPTDEQQKAADKLVSYLSDRVKAGYPEAAKGVVLEDKDDVISDAVQAQAKTKPAPAEAAMSPETRHAVGQTRRFNGSGGADMPMTQAENMGSFRTRDVPRQPNETDRQAATKEAWAGLFNPEKRESYDTVRKSPDGHGYRVGRYGFSGDQLGGFLAGLGDPPDPALIDKLVKEGKLPKAFAEKLKNPEFMAKMKEFAAKMKSGDGEISKEEMRQFLPKDAQEGMATAMIDSMKGKIGDNPGQLAAAMMSGKSADNISQADLNTPEAREMAQAGQTLFDIATARQRSESNERVVGQVPTGDRRHLIENALRLAGVSPSDANIAAVNTIVQKESSWNPNAVNDWDSNARKGTPSKGLMQTIGPTFRQYALPGYDKDMTDPTSNLVAGIRYATARYGSLQNVPGIRAMARGNAYRGY